jgi:hypothetical protein
VVAAGQLVVLGGAVLLGREVVLWWSWCCPRSGTPCVPATCRMPAAGREGCMGGAGCAAGLLWSRSGPGDISQGWWASALTLEC